MGQSLRVFQVDAFTAQRFTGNPAGVVLDADALSDTQMQAIARELNQGDTAFVLQPDGSDHDLRVRFFTPRREAAFVGHATLAAHAVFAELGIPPRSRQKQLAGSVEVDTLAGSQPARIAIHQSPPPLQAPPTAALLAAVLDALSLKAADLDPRCPPLIAGAASGRLLLGLGDGRRLAGLQPDLPRLATLSAELRAPGYFLFSLRPTLPDVYTEARMFCPALGFAEDPVSGNAHALLGHYLLRQGLLALDASSDTDSEQHSGTIEFTGAQGHHMGRPGHVTVALNSGASGLESISIIGEAVIALRGSLQV